MQEGRVKDMTVGNPLKVILLFAVPVFFGNLFQQLYNIVDTTIAGHCLGDTVLGGMGATSSVYNLIFGFSGGLNFGFAMLVARAFGEKDEEKVRNSVALMLVLNIVATLLITSVSVVSIGPLLHVLHTPDSFMAIAYRYIVIILLGLPITICYNMQASILQALGNSRTPLMFLILSTILNIALDFLFVMAFGWQVTGVALATVVAQLISAICCFVHIKRHYPQLKLHRENFVFQKEQVIEMLSMGFSMGLMNSIYAIGSVILQGAINKISEAAVTAHYAARRLTEILMLPLSTLSMANATFVGQNFGAGNMKRIKEGMKQTCVMGFIWSTIAVIITYLFGEYAVVAITNSSDIYVLENATRYLRINVPFFYALIMLLVLRTSLQGIGRKVSPVVSSSVELVAKIVATIWVVPMLQYFGVCIIEPIIWILCTIVLLGTFCHIYKGEVK